MIDGDHPEYVPDFRDEEHFTKEAERLATKYGWFGLRVSKGYQRGRMMTLTNISGFDEKVTAWPDRTFWSAKGGLIIREFKMPDGEIRPYQPEVIESLALAGIDAKFVYPSEWHTDLVPTFTYRKHRP